MPHSITTFRGLSTVNHTMFEADRISPLWVRFSRRCDTIILPTESSRRAWQNSGVPGQKLRLCPLGVDPDRFSGGAEPLPLRDDRGEAVSPHARIRFLNVSEIGPRKNLAGLLRAWLRATTRHDDAMLVLKLGSYSPGSRRWLETQIRVLELESGRSLADAAPVHMIYDIFSDEEMPRLFACATHYISMSHGEGWDQPMVEAAASGLTLIAPDHSAYRAYLDESCAHLLSVTEIPANFPVGSGLETLFQNAMWWEPDENAAVTLIRSIIDGTASEKISPRDRILRDLTWENAARRLITLLTEVEMRRRRRFWRLPLLYMHSSKA